MSSVWFYDYPIGCVGIAESGGMIVRVFFGRAAPSGFTLARTNVIEKASSQLFEYFKGKRTVFDLPLYLNGSDFSIRILTALQQIPYGETKTYKELADLAGCKNAARAAGGALNRNPIAIIVPCHRIIGSNGSLTGFAGGLFIKRYLLEMEAKHI